ncbi:patatin-like phospholipase family protein [Bradyrhizobium sp. RP6]|uniref:patatin-like phospholipase family protein n=1 Tax=Bradyrhizobium sp. RP6 TaxID=2489596 RepID=UPI000F5474D2|nr:patatin-like phospholipase family protein [Bradyrhizobium sp. RP6]RQH12693.1 patatin-like phospholipase family protein [Bradyrhizobium sp. RP6]
MAEVTISTPVGADAAGPDFLGAGKLEDGIGLCLSGGGFRAMLFHLGAFVRLNELGLLPRLVRIASVSGGSIAAGALAVAWKRLNFDEAGVAVNLDQLVAAPLIALAQKRVDVPAIGAGLLPFLSAANLAARVYDRSLFHEATLQDLPDSPRFSFTATSLQTGTLWRFAKEYAADWRVGRWDKPSLKVSIAVGASAAFPPYLSPLYVKPPQDLIVATEGADLSGENFSRSLCLTDGGIYDNLGLEPVWKRYRTILVSDGGALTSGLPSPRSNWLSQAVRTTNIALQQGINMRRRMLRGLHASGARNVVYWGINDPVAAYNVGNPLDFTKADSDIAAAAPTRLTRYPTDTQKLIVRAGYAHADAALRASSLRDLMTHSADFSRLMAITSAIGASSPSLGTKKGDRPRYASEARPAHGNEVD